MHSSYHTRRVVDASNQRLSKVSRVACPGPRNEVAVLNVDGNNLSTLVGVEAYAALIQLSARDNSIVKMEACRSVTSLVTLNLQGNSISEIAGLKSLVNLQWLSLAGNNIMNMDGMSSCIKLNYLDLSENCITEILDISSLLYLKTLLLHGNAIGSLRSIPQCFPGSIVTLSLAENEVSDLNEVSFMQSLACLEQLSLLNNPCVSIMDARIFDCRPYVLFWRPTLTTLDGVDLTAEERRTSQTLFPPGKPYPFSLGEHHVLVHYLSSIYPLPSKGSSKTQRLSPVKRELLTSPDKSMQVSLSELEDLLAKSSSMDRTGMVQKLRALQLVDQMIATQEQLIGQERDGVGDVDGFAPRVPSEVKAESAVKTYGVATTDQAQDFRRGADQRGHVSDLELVADSGSGAGALDPGKGEGHGESPVVSHPSSLSSLQDCRKQQLRLINEKLAKRHSMLHRKDLSCRQDKQSETPAIMSAVRGDSEVPPAPSVVVKSSKDGPLVSKTALMQPTLSREVPGKSVAYRPTTYSNISYPMSVGEGINHHLTQTESFTLRDPLPTSTKGDLLESESSFLPVSLLRDSSVSPDLSGHEDSTVHHPEDTDMYINSLLSSLNSAYGYSSLSDKSRLLSTLVGSERLQLRDTLDAPSPEQPDFHGEAVKIQAAYRGHIARKEYRRQLREQKAALLIQATWRGLVARKRDPRVRAVRGELCRIKLEAYVHTLHDTLQTYSRELTEQIHLSRLQGQAIETLSEEVKGLQVWRDDWRERERDRAAVVLQRHWKGYAARKRFAHRSCQLVPSRLALWKLCHTLQKQMRHLESLVVSKGEGVVEAGAGVAEDTEQSLTTKNSSLHAPSDLPRITDLQMSHHSDNCVLLRWSPPQSDPSHLHSSSPTHYQKLGYRVYVNGNAEGMVGPDKLKAYIEGLDKDTTYRITVRVVYSSGESEDSNPIIASLDSSPQHVTQHDVQLSQLSEEPQQHHNGSTDEGKRLYGSSQHQELPPRTEGEQPSRATIEEQPIGEGELPTSAADPPRFPQHHLNMSVLGESEPGAVTTHQFHYQSTGKSRQECAANLDVNSPRKPDPNPVDPGDRVQAHAQHQASGDVSHLSSGDSGAHDRFATDPPKVNAASPLPASLGAKDHMSKMTSDGAGDPSSAPLDSTASSAVTPVDGSLEMDPPDAQGGVMGGSRSGPRVPDPSASEGHLVESGSHQLVKPCLSNPAEARPTASGLHCGTTTLSSTSSGGTASGPSVHFSSFESPQEDVGLLQPITTRSLISGTISSPSLPPVNQAMGSTGGDGGGSSSVLCGIQCEPSTALNEALMYQTKQATPFAITAVPSMGPMEAGVFHHSHRHAAPDGVGGLESSTSPVCVPGWDIGVSGAGTVHQATDLHTGSMGSEVTAFNPKADTGIGHRGGLTAEGDDKHLDVGAAELCNIPETRGRSSGDFVRGDSRATIDILKGTHGSEVTTKLTVLSRGATDLAGGNNSTNTREHLCHPGGSSDAKGRLGPEICSDNSTTWCQELAQQSNSDISQGQAEHKQTIGQLSSHLEKCFEAGEGTLPLPKGGSDSIISLGETAASPDSTHGSKPRRQTMPSAFLEQDHKALCPPFISEGGGGRAKEVGSVSELNDMGNTSMKMASLLLSQLESDLTNSLTEDTSN